MSEPRPIRIFGVDPGLATGWCFYDAEEQVIHLQESGPQSFYRFALNAIEMWEAQVVVCESFIITPATAKKTQQPWSLELIGVLRYLCWQCDVTFHLQPPSIKRYVTNDALKSAGWWLRGSAGHAHDAARHVAFYCAQNGVHLSDVLTHTTTGE